jgi:hypothetical protein
LLRVWYSPELSSFSLIIQRGYFDGGEEEKEDELEKFGGAAGGLTPPVCYSFGASGHIQRSCPNNK